MKKDKKGKLFEEEVLKTLQDMDIESYGSHSQIPLPKLNPKHKHGHHLEIDIVCLVGRTCILIETTIQNKDNHQKIEKFINKCKRLRKSKLNKRDLFACFSGIPENNLNQFTSVSDWRYLYIGTSSELITQNITSKDYPDADCLEIFNKVNWEYFKALESAIKSTSRYEFFASLKINPSDLKDPVLGSSLPPKPCLELTNITFNPGQIQANLAVAIFTPDELLRITRVLRYQGQPISLSAGTSLATENVSVKKSSGYQRILNREKLKQICDFVNKNHNITFPTNLTLVLSRECEVRNKELYIPPKYASIDVIDGQHRLFSYALSDEKTRQNAKLIATAIKFHTEDPEEINRYAAQTFITINSKQTKVKSDLIYLISYDVLDNKTPEAIAAKILKECDSKANGPIEELFELRAFIKKNKFGQTPIPIATIIRELSRIFKPENLESIKHVLGEEAKDHNESDPLFQVGKQLVDRYFSAVKSKFSKDWRNADSLLMSTKYMSAFIRLLETFIEEELTINQMYQELAEISQNIFQKYSKGRINGQQLVFAPGAFHSYTNEEGIEVNEPLLSKKAGSIEQIYKLLNENRQSDAQS